MCFSAPGSFILGAALVGSGGYSVKLVKKRKYLPLACMPLFFGLQQLSEGVVWLALAAQNRLFITIFGLIFLFFAIFVWLLWIPLLSYVLEPPGWRKKRLKLFLWVGALYGATYYLLHVVNYKYFKPYVIHHSIAYDSFITNLDMNYLLVIYLLYIIIIIGSLMTSSLPSIRNFGVLTIIGVLITVLFFFYAFSSVWCFVAAILSFYIVWVIHKSNGDVAKIAASDKNK